MHETHKKAAQTSPWTKIFMVLVLGGGFYVVIMGGATAEQERLYYIFSVAVLLVFGVIKWQAILGFFTKRFRIVAAEDKEDAKVPK